MPHAKLFINNTRRALVKATVSREGCRAIDQAKFVVPPETPVDASDTIVYVQDMVNVFDNTLLFNFCEHVKDESGYNHHPDGHTDFPSSLSHWDFQNTTEDIGTLRNTATELPLDCMCVETPSVYIAGKVMCNNDVNDRAIVFACCRYLTIADECEYDLRQDQRWSMSAWLYPTANCCDAMVMGKRVGIDATDAGYSLNYHTCARASFEIADGTCEWSVTSAACSVPLCMWTNVTATFDGTSNQLGMKIYINGELNSTGTACAITPTVTNNAFFSLGATACTTDHYCGRVDGAYFFEKELTICEVASLHHEGGLDYICGLWNGKAVCFDGDKGHLTIRDAAPSCPRPCNIKLQLKFECNLTDSSCTNCCISMDIGCSTFTCGLIDDNAFCFNGARSIKVCCNNFNFNITSEFTASAWVKVDMCSSGADMLLGKRDGLSMCDAGWNIGIASGDKANINLGNGTTEFAAGGTTCIRDCLWHHIVGTYDGTSNQRGLKIYVDGILEGTGCCTAITGCSLNCVHFSVGAAADLTLDYTGLMDCVRVWNKELTNKEVKHIHDSTFGNSFRGPYELITWIKAPSTSCCDRTIFHKSSTMCTGVELSINDSAGGGPGFTCSGYTCGFTAMTGGAGCSIFYRHNTTILTSSTDITDSCWHQIRVKRDACNLISLYVDNVLEDSCTDTTCAICAVPANFARDFSMCEHYDGGISSFRLYSTPLTISETDRLWNCRNPRSNVKFGGDSTKVTKLIEKKELITQSFGKELGEIEVRAQQFCNRSPEFILQTLIKDNTNLDTHFHGTPAGITLGSYQADGKIVDIANDLSQLTGKVYHTDGLRQFHLHDASFTITTVSFDHKVTMRNFETAEDDIEIVNCLLIIGENKRFTTSCTFMCVDGVQSVFDLVQSPVTARVFSPSGCCTEVCPEEDYDVNTVTKQLTFTACSIPACGTCVLIEYEYEIPLNIRGKCDASIEEFGVKAKRLILPWITSRQDGVRFINAYLENFRDIKFRTTAEVPGLANGVNENDVISVRNDVKGIPNTSFIVKSLTWEYPAGKTIMQLGEFNFQMLEFAKQITEKIHDLESAVVRVKDLRDYENPQEILNLTDSVNVNVTEEFSECITMTDCVSVTETFDAVYDGACTTYDGDDAYV